MNATSRHAVKIANLDPKIPSSCVACLNPHTSRERTLVFRRADGTVERVCVARFPYCQTCFAALSPLDRAQRWMTWLGALQMLVVIYIVGAALGHYLMWWPSLGVLTFFFVVFIYHAKNARRLWDLEWARIDDVYKGGSGVAFSFRNLRYAESFAEANR